MNDNSDKSKLPLHKRMINGIAFALNSHRGLTRTELVKALDYEISSSDNNEIISKDDKNKILQIKENIAKKQLTEEDRRVLLEIAGKISRLSNNGITTDLQHRWFAIEQGLQRDEEKETTRVFGGNRKSKRRRNRKSKTRRRKN